MTEKARVIDIDGSKATVECYEHQGCGSCSSAFCNPKARTYQASLPEDVEINNGDPVVVHLPPSKAIYAGFLVLIFPLILFLVGYVIAEPLESEALRLLVGLGGLAVGFLGVLLMSRIRPPQLPQIVGLDDSPIIAKNPAELLNQ